jgi:hypothetical protein
LHVLGALTVVARQNASHATKDASGCSIIIPR